MATVIQRSIMRTDSTFMEAVREIRENSKLEYAVVWCSNGGREDQVVDTFSDLNEAETKYEEELKGRQADLVSENEELKNVTSPFDSSNRDIYYLAILKITPGEDEYEFDYEEMKASEMYYYKDGII